MGKIILVLVCIFLAACGTKKSVTRNVKLPDLERYESSNPKVVLESAEPEEVETVVVESSAPDELVMGDGIGLGSVGTIGHGAVSGSGMGSGSVRHVRNVRYVETNSDYESNSVSDNSNEASAPRSAPSSMGKVAISIQDTMKVGNTYNVKLRITREGGNTFLSGIVEDTTKRTTVYIERVRISSVMSAKLSDPEGKFEIKMVGDNISQSIEEEGFTEWEWVVKPIKSGMNKLVVVLTIRIEDTDGFHPKDIEVMNKTILTKVNPIYTIVDFVKENWAWIIGFMTPIVTWLWNRRRKRRRNA